MPAQVTKKDELPALEVPGKWSALFDKEARPRLEKALRRFLAGQRWFRAKARHLRTATISETIWSNRARLGACLAIVRVEYMEGEPETYLVPISFASGERAGSLLENTAHAVICRVSIKNPDQTGLLYDASVDPDFASRLLESISKQRLLKGMSGELTAKHTRAFKTLSDKPLKTLEASTMGAEQTNTSIRFEDRFILKLYRRLDEGINSEVEIGRFLTDRGFPFVAQLAGEIEYRPYRGRRREPTTIAILHGWVPNHGDAWKYTLDVLTQYVEERLARRPNLGDLALPEAHLLDLAADEPPPTCYDLIGSYLESARLLGERTAQLHSALASGQEDPNFSPEKFTSLYQRSLYQSMLNLSEQVLEILKQRLRTLPEVMKEEAKALIARRDDVRTRFKSILDKKIDAIRIRCHGDYHLGQILYTGNDFVIMDFEGEPARSLGERRIKRSPLVDVAGMLRSFQYAAYSALFALQDSGLVRTDDVEYAESLVLFWDKWVRVKFLQAYLGSASPGLLPKNRDELRRLLDAYLLDKAVYELGYELNNRPNWVKIPLQGIRTILE